MPDRDLRLLALDGGGVRGLSELMILGQLMEAVDPDAPPKPCDYFDMIGGTSTGGLIAIMLGRLRMSVPDCISAYLALSDRIFRKKRHRVTVKGKVQGRFDSEELVRAVKEVVQAQGLPQDALLKDTSENANACKVFVCATSKEAKETVCLTSYRTPRGNNDLLNSVKIWEACRATSAASSFFDPIAIGRYGEEFVDGATGANNPVRQLWDQAQLAWGPEPLEGKIKCLVSIGTGVPSLKPFQDDVFHIGETLIAIATETEQTAESFRRERSLLDSSGRYYRFNVSRGLEDIGLEESKKVKEMVAATRRYISSQEVYTRMQACAGHVAGKEYSGEYQTNFSLEGVPRASQFVDRPAEMAELERVLLPRDEKNHRQKIYVLRGLGGMGKTQLAVEFARRHHLQFSSVFWLDGRSEDSLKRSIASCASRIPQRHIPETSRAYTADGSADIDAIVRDVMNWLARPDNSSWLLIFDNVDREYNLRGDDPLAYDVTSYFSGADHGSVLVTTRLARLEQLGESQQLGKVNEQQAQGIFESRYRRKHDIAEGKRLLELLDGLPLAIAQAGAYLQETGVGLPTYLRFYEQQWSELMESKSVPHSPLQDYPDRGVWTTWALSYTAVRAKHEGAANLLLLWSFLDNKDLWYGLFEAACQKSPVAKGMLTKWIGNIAGSELEFSSAMRLLRNYSLIEEMEASASYATHPVVHRWAYYYQGQHYASELCRLAVVTVGMAVPEESTRNYWAMLRRLLSHAQVGTGWVEKIERDKSNLSDGSGENDVDGREEQGTFLDAINCLGVLYRSNGKLEEAEQMYNRALRGMEAFGPNHVSTLTTVNNLGNLYFSQGKLDKAEQMYNQALQGMERIIGPNHISTLTTVNNLGLLYKDQGKLEKAEQMFNQALRGKERTIGPNHISTLTTVNNLGRLYLDQGRLDEAEQMYNQALLGNERTIGPNHISTLSTVNDLGNLYFSQGKLDKAEQMYERALQGMEAFDGSVFTYTIVQNLGIIYAHQGRVGEAEQMYERALRGMEEALGHNTLQTYKPALNAMTNMGDLYASQGRRTSAQEMYSRALPGLQTILGHSHDRCQRLAAELDALNNAEETSAEPPPATLSEPSFQGCSITPPTGTKVKTSGGRAIREIAQRLLTVRRRRKKEQE